MKLRIGAAVIVGLLGASALHALPWTERPYNPPVGSKWSVVSQSISDETRAGGDHRNQKIVSHAEFSIDEKLPDGYRVTYINRAYEITGNAPNIAIMNRALAGTRNVTVHGRIDAAGRPVAVDNLDEVKATMQALIDRVADSFSATPKVAAAVKEMMEAALMVDGADAAKNYMEELSGLAAGQNTALKPGEVRRENSTVTNPLTGPIKSTLTTQLTSWDDRAGTARYNRRQSVDEATMKVAIAAIASRLMKATDAITPEVVEMMKKVSLSIDNETTIAVETGMTKSVEEHETSKASLMGHTVSKDERKTVTVTRMP